MRTLSRPVLLASSLLMPVLILALAGCNAAGPENANPTMRRATPAGAGVRIASYARWNERCEQAGLPVAMVTRAPSHGTLSARPVSVTVGNRRFSGQTNCRDKEIPGIELFYTPEPGFRGTDAMGYQVTEDGTALPFTATVDVR